MTKRTILLGITFMALVLVGISVYIHVYNPSPPPGIWIESPVPMPVSLLNDLENVEGWNITIYTFDNSNPPRPMRSTVSSPTVFISHAFGVGSLLGIPGEYYCEFPDLTPFTELIVYMRDHPDVFFDYTEFQGGFWYTLPQGYDEYLRFEIGVEGDQNFYGIAKPLMPSGNPPEIEYVFDQLHLYRDEILQHPR